MFKWEVHLASITSENLRVLYVLGTTALNPLQDQSLGRAQKLLNKNTLNVNQSNIKKNSKYCKL